MKISVVTPSLNQARFIESTLASVEAQEGVDLEHWVIDGGSNDGTVDILSSWRGRMQWISERDRGQSHAINKGIDRANGEAVTWLNSDDTYAPGALRQMVDTFSRLQDVGVVYGQAKHIDEMGRPLGRYPTMPWNLSNLFVTCFICQPAAAIRREAVERFGPLNEALQYCMDYEYWLRLGSTGVKFAYVEHELAQSRLYADNKTLRDRVAVHREINDMFRYRFGRVPERWLTAYTDLLVHSAPVGSQFAGRVRLRWLRDAVRNAREWNGAVSASIIAEMAKVLLRGPRTIAPINLGVEPTGHTPK